MFKGPFAQNRNVSPRDALLSSIAVATAAGVSLAADNDLSPNTTNQQLAAIRHMVDEIGIEISGLCSFLFRPYPLSSDDSAK